ncbi:CHAD domain-containing protein [Solimonas soli]|uniref:CHAD domain-containing protein n=1 Tax=Solimonas soli TaxID=413479 RepID=UPI0005BD9108|nr:CHAD domain-containing protein [Solimonas soli]
MRATAALPRLLAPRLREVAQAIDAAASRDDLEVWHHLRVGIVRLRVALSACRDVLPKTARRQLDHELRWLRRQLAEVRDWDVFVQRQASAADVDPGLRRAARARLRRSTSQARDIVQGRRCRALAQHLRRCARQLRAPAPHAAATLSLAELADHALRRRRRKLRRRGRHIGQLRSDDLHRLRLAVKKLRYTAELFRALHAEPAFEQGLHELEHLQDVLGDIHDRELAAPLSARLARDAGLAAPAARRSRIGARQRRALLCAWAAVATAWG